MDKDSGYTSEELLYMGEVISPDVLDLSPVVLPAIESLYAERPVPKPAQLVGEFVGAIGLEERHAKLKIVSDLVGLKRSVDGKVETYLDKIRHAEGSGKVESARYGVASIMGERAVVYVLDWDYFAGSLGEVAGEKFEQATQLAMREKLPFVSMGASSGVRQHENVLGLVQMQRMAVAASKFQHVSDKPYISVLAGQMWGGMSASAVPTADLVVAMQNTNYGFAGPRVIESFEGIAVPDGAQSAEANLLQRNIDVLVKDTHELVEFLGRSLQAIRRHHSKNPGELVPTGIRVAPANRARSIVFGPQGFYPLLPENHKHERVITVDRNRSDTPDMAPRERLMARYNEIVSSAGRLDSEFIMQHTFDTSTPLYNTLQFGDLKKYPAVIASIATIGEHAFMVIGDQPSYIARTSDYAGKRSPNPGPEDYEYAVRMMEAAERWKLPIVFLTDTLGALPTIAAERRGQSRAIARAIKTAGSYPYPTISVITGALGSGGGLATTPFGRDTIMLDSALAFVSEPVSMASILYRTESPTLEQVAMTLETIKASAQDLRAQGLVDTIVDDGDNPYVTAQALRQAVVAAYEKQRRMSPRRLRRDAAARLTPKMISRNQAGN